jgi:hypothetical protein
MRQKMTMAERLKNLQSNIKTGKEREAEQAEARKRKENEEADRQAAMELKSLATSIMIRDGSSWYESIEAAKREIQSVAAKEEEI